MDQISPPLTKILQNPSKVDEVLRPLSPDQINDLVMELAQNPHLIPIETSQKLLEHPRLAQDLTPETILNATHVLLNAPTEKLIQNTKNVANNLAGFLAHVRPEPHILAKLCLNKNKMKSHNIDELFSRIIVFADTPLLLPAAQHWWAHRKTADTLSVLMQADVLFSDLSNPTPLPLIHDGHRFELAQKTFAIAPDYLTALVFDAMNILIKDAPQRLNYACAHRLDWVVHWLNKSADRSISVLGHRHLLDSECDDWISGVEKIWPHLPVDQKNALAQKCASFPDLITPSMKNQLDQMHLIGELTDELNRPSSKSKSKL